MLILVAVTVTIAMDGGIFTKAKKGATDTQFKADEEQLTAAVAGCYNGITGEIDGGSLNDALDGWEIVAGNDNWTCTSVKGNKFTVTNKGKITYVENTETGKGEEEKITPGATFGGYYNENEEFVEEEKTLTWEELKLEENGKKYGYDSSAISDESIGYSAFCDHGGILLAITIPNSVTSIGDYAFCGGHLTTIMIPKSVINIGEYAIGGDNLVSISVDENNSKYSDIDGVLFNKDKTILITYPQGKDDTSYIIPNSVTSIEECAFSECVFTSITIPNCVTSIGGWAFDESSLESISYDGNTYTSGSTFISAFISYNKNNTIGSQIFSHTKLSDN